MNPVIAILGAALIVAFCGLAVLFIDALRWNRSLKRMAEAQRTKPWGDVIELHPEAKTFHTRRSSQ